MLASLGSTLSRVANAITGGGEEKQEEAPVDPNVVVTTGIKVEVWVELNETLKEKVTRFAAKMVKPHACGQWLVCDWEVHEKSSNPTFKGFQKVYRKKYKPTKMKQQCEVILNSDNNTDSNPEIWGHVIKILNEFAPIDVYIERESGKKSMRNRKK